VLVSRRTLAIGTDYPREIIASNRDCAGAS